MIVEVILTVISAIILFPGIVTGATQKSAGEDKDYSKMQSNLTHSWEGVVFIMLMAWLVAATTEEITKAAIVRLRCCCCSDQ
jgi:hypothetical protein